MSKFVLILINLLFLFGVFIVFLFKSWRKEKKCHKDEHDRAERLRYQLELKENQEKIMAEVMGDVEKKENEVTGLSGRDKYNAMSDRMRNNKKNN